MNKIKLEQGFKLVTILSAITFVVLSTATNSWASERSTSQDNDSENQVRSETNENNEISGILNDDTESSEINNENRTNIEVTNNNLTVGPALLSVKLQVSNVSGATGGMFVANIE